MIIAGDDIIRPNFRAEEKQIFMINFPSFILPKLVSRLDDLCHFAVFLPH